MSPHGIPWPRLESGRLDLSDDTFRQMARAYPAVSPMRELRSALSEMRLSDLAVGSDGRNRTMLSAFRSRTGRYQPSNTRYIFGPSVWLRDLIKPPPGHGVAYIDWCQQELGIAAVLSGDTAMQAAYTSGDPYLAFAKQAGAVPPDATKHTHGPQRELFKQCALGRRLRDGGRRAGSPHRSAGDCRRAICCERTTKPIASSGAGPTPRSITPCSPARSRPRSAGRCTSAPNFNPRSLRNFPCQANGAEMLRLAACFATEQGIEVCALIHDAVLICAPLDRLDADVEGMRAAWPRHRASCSTASSCAPTCTRSGIPTTTHDPRGTVMWDRVMRLIAAREGAKQQREAVVMADPFDLERLRVNPADLQRKPKRKKWHRDYVQVPWTGSSAYSPSKRVSTYRLALLLLYEFWRTGKRPVVLSNISAQAEGLSPPFKMECPDRVGGAGAHWVERALRKSPRVTPLCVSREYEHVRAHTYVHTRARVF